MWSSVLLSHSLAGALLKCAIKQGHVRTISPQTRSEGRQIGQYLGQLFRTRCDREALQCAILAENIYLDDFDQPIFKHLWSDKSLECRSVIGHVSPDFKSFVRFTDSSRNNAKTLYVDVNRRAALYSAIEPMIWRSFHKTRPAIGRSTLRDALAIIAIRPDIIRVWDFRKAKPIVRQVLIEHWPDSRIDRATVDVLQWTCHDAVTKGSIAANILEEAARRNAVYAAFGFSFGAHPAATATRRFRAFGSDHIVASIRLFLDEIQYWPLVESFDDLLRLRSDKRFGQFRSILSMWVDAILTNGVSAEAHLRRDISSANQSLRKATACARVGRWFTYLGLPLAVLDNLVFPVFGTLASIVGVALQAYADWNVGKSQWICIGKQTT